MTRDGCICCPYPNIAIPGAISFAAMVFTSSAAFYCNFFSAYYRGSEPLRAGLWTVEWASSSYSYHSSYCIGWYQSASDLSDFLDGPLIAARAFSMISVVLGLIAFILILIPSCVTYGESKQQDIMIQVGFLVVLGIFTLLDLVALYSDLCRNATICTLEAAGVSAIVGGVLWWVCAGLMFWAVNNPRQLRRKETVEMLPECTCAMETAVVVAQPMEEMEVKTVQNADGSRETTTTTTVSNPDGSKTVTKTTEVMPAFFP